jgi:hypothetical protein
MGVLPMMKLQRKVALFLMALVIFATVTPAYAQEGETATQSPAGIGVLILLMGIAAILIVGGLSSARAQGESDDKEE